MSDSLESRNSCCGDEDEALPGLSIQLGRLILLSMQDAGRLSSAEANSAAHAKMAAEQLLSRALGIIAAVGQLKQLQYPGGRFYLSEAGIFIEPFRSELERQVCIGEAYCQTLFERLHDELKSCLRYPGASGGWGQLAWEGENYVVELSQGPVQGVVTP